MGTLADQDDRCPIYLYYHHYTKYGDPTTTPLDLWLVATGAARIGLGWFHFQHPRQSRRRLHPICLAFSNMMINLPIKFSQVRHDAYHLTRLIRGTSLKCENLFITPFGQGNLFDMIVLVHFMTEFRQPLKVQIHLEMPGILVQLGHIQRT